MNNVVPLKASTEQELTLLERLTICDTVVRALKNKTNMTELMAQFPLAEQLEAIRFMEFLNQRE